MPDEARLIFAFGLALATALAATPVAIAVAARIGFQDQPIGYKGHRAPTPYLGGAAVVVAFLLAGVSVGGELARLSPVVAGAFAVWCLGTTDDKLNLSPGIRLSLEFGVASSLWATGLGWSLFDSGALNLILTNLWVVGLMNAFNLMDNMDGAAATVGAVTTLATAVLASMQGDIELAILCVGMSGACLGFLPYNLAGPARIFLGDGGSLPVGFVTAAAIMALPDGGNIGWPVLLAAVMLAGLPVVDTTLVLISRRRAGIRLLTGGRDHLTHRLATRLGSPRTVALTLGAVQALLGAVAIAVMQLGEGSIVSAAGIWFVAATAAVVLLETRAWAPERMGMTPTRAAAAPVPQRSGASARVTKWSPRIQRSPTFLEGAVIVFITAACGLSPALYGFYRPSVWGPIALGVLAILLGLVIARPAAPRRAALAAIVGLAFLWLWSLVSTSWSESAHQAMLEANRWLLYAALFAVLVLLLRNDRLSTLLVGTATAAIVAFGAYLAVRLLLPGGPELFLSNRLHEPLGYVNGQAGYLMLGVWPLVALAERTRHHLRGGAAIAAATLLVGIALLGQTRAILPAAIISVVVMLAVLPGRRTRAWALLAVVAGVGLAAGPLVDVFDSGDPATGAPDLGTLRSGVGTLLGASLLSGVVWTLGRRLATAAEPRFGERRLALASAAVLTSIAVIGLGVGLASTGNPASKVRDEFRAFKGLELQTSSAPSSRFASGGGTRHDYWRVALDQVKDHPVEGIGAGNYARTYFVERRTTEDVRQPHSLPLQTLAELGLVGGIGLFLFLGAILAGFVRRARAARGSQRDLGLAVAAGGMFIFWLAHTSVDWLHLIPGVTGIALFGAAVLVAPWVRENGEAQRSPLRVAVLGACGVAVFAGAILVGRAALADKYRSEAQELVARDPHAALERAADSLALNDEALPAYYTRAAAYARLNDYARARASLLEAARREPHNFVPRGLLGDIAVRRGDLRQARLHYGQAYRLNPRDAGLKALAVNPRAALASPTG